VRRTLNFLVNLGDEHEPVPLSVGFLLDLSGSMAGEPREALRRALLQSIGSLSARVGNSPEDESTVVAFDSDIRDVCPWIPRDEFDFLTDCLSAIPDFTLKGGGTTRLHDALWHTCERFLRDSKPRNERVMFVCSDGGECASTENTKADVIRKLSECNNGSISKALADEVAAAPSGGDLLASCYAEAGDRYVLVQPNDSCAAALSRLPVELQTRVAAALGESRRPLRVFSLHFGSDDDGLMKELAAASGGRYFRGVSFEAIAGMLEEAVKELAWSRDDGVRGFLSRRLAQAQPLAGDFARVISVNSRAGNPDGVSARAVRSGMVYDFTYADPEGGIERDGILSAFRGACDLSKGVRELLIQQSQAPAFKDAGVLAEPLVVVSLRGGDKVGLALAEECVRALEAANANGTLFNRKEGAGAEVVFVVLLDGWETYDESQWHRLYAFFLELSNTKLESSVMGVSLVASHNECDKKNEGRGFTHLTLPEYESLVVEILAGLNRWQPVEAKLAELAEGGKGACSRFVSLGALSLFVDKDAAIGQVARREIANLLVDAFKPDPPWVDDANAAGVAEAFDANLDEERLWHLLVASGKPNRTLVELIAGQGIGAFSFYEQAKRVILPDHTSSIEPTRPVTYRYEDFEDYAGKSPLDIEEFISVAHSLDFFRARLDRNADEVIASISRELETLTDAQLCRMLGTASPAQARLCLTHLASRIKTRLERAGENMAATLVEKTAEAAPETVRLEVRPGVFVEKSAADWEKLRDAAIHYLRTRPHPQAAWAKYLQMGTLLGSGAAGALLAGAGVLFWAPLAVLAAAMPLAAGWKLARRTRQIAELLELYEATHRSIARRQAIQLVKEKIGQVWEHILAKAGEKDEVPAGDDLDPYASDRVSERALMELFRRDAGGTLSDWLRLEPDMAEESPFRVNLAKGELHLRGRTIDGPVKVVGDSLGLRSNAAWQRSVIAAEASLKVYRFPGVVCRFVPSSITGLRDSTIVKIRVQEIVREREYRILAVAPLDVDDIKALKALYENAEWSVVIDRLFELSAESLEERQEPVFLRWREIARYKLWLMKLARLVNGQDSSEKDLDIYTIWRRLARSRREFRTALEKIVCTTVELTVADRLAIFSLVAADSYSPGGALFEYVEGFSVAPVRLQKLGAAYPGDWSSYFLSGRNANLEGSARPFGVLHKAGWDKTIPRAVPSSVSSGQPRELVNDFEVGFVHAVAVPSTHVEALTIAASKFFELEPDRQQSFLLDDYGSLVGHGGTMVQKTMCKPFTDAPEAPKKTRRNSHGEGR
jgi:hypothetical protein